MQKNRPQQGQQPRRCADDMAANLAKELGLSEAKVQAALEELMPQGGPPRRQRPGAADGDAADTVGHARGDHDVLDRYSARFAPAESRRRGGRNLRRQGAGKARASIARQSRAMLPRLIAPPRSCSSLVAAAPAAADSIAYIQGNDIWLATPDGARKQQVTHTGGYFYVSQADDGTMAALVGGEKLQKLSRTGQVLADFPTYVSDGSPVGGPVTQFHGPFDPRDLARRLEDRLRVLQRHLRRRPRLQRADRPAVLTSTRRARASASRTRPASPASTRTGC